MNFFKTLFKQKEGLKLQGGWKLIAKHIKTGEIIVKEGKNLIVDDGNEFVGDLLLDPGLEGDVGLKYCALGSDATAPAAGQANLVNEGDGPAMRDTFTTDTRAANVVTITTFFAAGACSIFIKEAGMFGGVGATGARNSGEMFSRWLVSFDNSLGAFDITIQYVLTIG